MPTLQKYIWKKLGYFHNSFTLTCFSNRAYNKNYFSRTSLRILTEIHSLKLNEQARALISTSKWDFFNWKRSIAEYIFYMRLDRFYICRISWQRLLMTVETLLEKRKSRTRSNRRKTLRQYFVFSLLQKQSPESSVKKVFLKFSQNLLENACAGVPF